MKPDFQKGGGLLPTIIQCPDSGQVLMQGYMNAEALEKTTSSGLVTFFSRSRNRLWVKGEVSGNVLRFSSVHLDCDADTLLVKARATGPVCHTGSATCFKDDRVPDLTFLALLEEVIRQRREEPSDESYTSSLFRKGINKIAQKVGEEAVELVIEAKDNDRGLFISEAADLLFHYMILLREKNVNLTDVVEVLRSRNKNDGTGG